MHRLEENMYILFVIYNARPIKTFIQIEYLEKKYLRKHENICLKMRYELRIKELVWDRPSSWRGPW